MQIVETYEVGSMAFYYLISSSVWYTLWAYDNTICLVRSVCDESKDNYEIYWNFYICTLRWSLVNRAGGLGQPAAIYLLLFSWFWPSLACDNNQKSLACPNPAALILNVKSNNSGKYTCKGWIELSKSQIGIKCPKNWTWRHNFGHWYRN